MFRLFDWWAKWGKKIAGSTHVASVFPILSDTLRVNLKPVFPSPIAISLYDRNKSQLRKSRREELRNGREKTDTREISGPTTSGL